MFFIIKTWIGIFELWFSSSPVLFCRRVVSSTSNPRIVCFLCRIKLFQALDKAERFEVLRRGFCASLFLWKNEKKENGRKEKKTLSSKNEGKNGSFENHVTINQFGGKMERDYKSWSSLTGKNETKFQARVGDWKAPDNKRRKRKFSTLCCGTNFVFFPQ